MSVQAMSWALKQQLEKHPQARHVLLCLANYAQADGTSAFPSNATLVCDTGLSESSVRRNLQKLEKAGLIQRDNPAIVAAKISRPDHRPTCYRINMEPRGVTMTPRSYPQNYPQMAVTGCQTEAPRGVKQPPNGVSSSDTRSVSYPLKRNPQEKDSSFRREDKRQRNSDGPRAIGDLMQNLRLPAKRGA